MNTGIYSQQRLHNVFLTHYYSAHTMQSSSHPSGLNIPLLPAGSLLHLSRTNLTTRRTMPPLHDLCASTTSGCSKPSTGIAALLSLLTIYVLFLAASIGLNLCVRRIKPKEFFLTSTNPLILVFTWPYHPYRTLQCYCQCNNIPSTKENEGIDSDEGRELTDQSTSQRLCPPAQHLGAFEGGSKHQLSRKPLPTYFKDQALDLGLSNQVHMEAKKS